MNFVQFHIGDWDSSTRLLSPLEKGVYIDLIFLYYSLERPLMRSECERISRAYTDEEKNALTYILSRFFMVDGDSYRHQRCDKEIAATRSKSAKAAASAKARWERQKANDEHEKVVPGKDADLCEMDANAYEAHMQNERERNAGAMLTDNRKPITNISTVQSNDCTREKNFFTLDSEPNADLKKQNCPTSEIVEIFNEVLAPELGRVKKLTSTRAQLVRARWHDVIDVTESKTRADALAGVKAYFEKVGRSDFLMGRLRDATWKADFDWLIKSENFVKVFENRYQNGR